MTSEPRAADPVDPDYLLQAFLILSERPEPANTGDPVMMTEADAERLLGRIANEVGTTPMMAFDLFRRCCAMANFFSVVSNRELINIDEAKPRPAIWAAAATVPVHQTIIDQMACDTYDPRNSVTRCAGMAGNIGRRSFRYNDASEAGIEAGAARGDSQVGGVNPP